MKIDLTIQLEKGLIYFNNEEDDQAPICDVYYGNDSHCDNISVPDEVIDALEIVQTYVNAIKPK